MSTLVVRSSLDAPIYGLRREVEPTRVADNGENGRQFEGATVFSEMQSEFRARCGHGHTITGFRPSEHSVDETSERS